MCVRVCVWSTEQHWWWCTKNGGGGGQGPLLCISPLSVCHTVQDVVAHIKLQALKGKLITMVNRLLKSERRSLSPVRLCHLKRGYLRWDLKKREIQWRRDRKELAVCGKEKTRAETNVRTAHLLLLGGSQKNPSRGRQIHDPFHLFGNCSGKRENACPIC